MAMTPNCLNCSLGMVTFPPIKWMKIASREIYAAFWAIDGVLATLDATGAI